MTTLKYLKSKKCPRFVGRQHELSLLADGLKFEGQASINSAVIQGLPGTGKTQLGLEFAFSQIKRHEGLKVILLEASSQPDLMAAVQRFFRNIRKNVETTPNRMRKWQDEDDRLIEAMSRKLETASREWLLLIDDVHESTYGYLRSMVPQTCERGGNVIITTRAMHLRRALEREGSEKARVFITLRGLECPDALELLAALCDPHNDRGIRDSRVNETYTKARRRLSCLPVLVEQFASFLESKQGSLDFKGLSDHDVEKIFQQELHHPMAQSPRFLQIWKPQMADLRSTRQVAADLLCILSLLSHKRIDIRLLARGLVCERAREFWASARTAAFLLDQGRLEHLQALLADSNELAVVVDMFAALGIVHLVPPSGLISFTDRTVQIAARLILMPSSYSEINWLRFTLDVFGAGVITASEPPSDEKQHSRLQQLVPHLRVLRYHSGRTSCWTNFLCVASSVWADSLEVRGKYKQALIWKHCALQGYKSGLFEVKPLALRRTVLQLGRLNLKQGLLREAEELIQPEYARRLLHLGACSETVEALKALMTVWIAQDNAPELANAIEHLQNLTGPPVAPVEGCSLNMLQLRDVLTKAMIRIGYSEDMPSQFEEAHRIGRETLNAKLKVFDEEDEEVLVTIDGVISALWAMCATMKRKSTRCDRKAMNKSARELMERMYKMIKRGYGQSHPLTQRISDNLKVWHGPNRPNSKWSDVFVCPSFDHDNDIGE